MMHDKKPINKINRLHERYLRVTYNDGTSSIELCKVFNDIYLDIMKDVFLVHLPTTMSEADALSPPDQLKQSTTKLSICHT